MQAVHAGGEQGPLGPQLGRQFRQLGMGGVQFAQVGGAEGMLFQGDEMQAPAGGRIVPPGGPGG